MDGDKGEEGDDVKEADILQLGVGSCVVISDGELEESEDDEATQRATKRYRRGSPVQDGRNKRFRLDGEACKAKAAIQGAATQDAEEDLNRSNNTAGSR